MDHGASSYRRFLMGDDNGLVEIIRDYKDGLIFYLNGYVKNIHAAEELAEEIRRRVAAMTAKLPHQEQIRDLRVLWDEFTMDNGLLTPTLKVRRREVEKRFTEVVEEMYSRIAARRKASKENSKH